MLRRQAPAGIPPVHPAAEMFPLLAEGELRELAEDIRQHGMRQPIAMLGDHVLDGRNRLRAIMAHGGEHRDKALADALQHARHLPTDTDPIAYVISANIRRRHLTAQQKRELIAKLLKADPWRSDRATARLVAADHKTVANVRAVGGEDRRGRQASAAKP
jgi:ParB-like chromosome segregation protein Spo0J